MTGPRKPGLFLCVPVHVWEEMPAALKAIATRADAPYERIECPRCRQMMMLSREGRAMLTSGAAESPICTDCLLTIAKDD